MEEKNSKMKNSVSSTRFETLDFGTVVTTSKIEDVIVTVDPRPYFTAYGVAMAKELQRRNPLRFQAIDQQIANSSDPLSGLGQAIEYYCLGLLQIRMDSINGGSEHWRAAKLLLIPTMIQEIMSRVGIVTLRAEGLRFVPVMKDRIHYDIDLMLDISSQLEVFQDDGFKLFKDAIPRDIKGDSEVMLCVLRPDGATESVFAKTALIHPNSTYVAAILGLHHNDVAISKEFRVRYDDVSFITSTLLKEVIKW